MQPPVQDGEIEGEIKVKTNIKMLSKHCLEILKREGPMKPKQVWQKLIMEMFGNGQVKQTTQNFERKKQNIKRRMYDAINVMISVGILEKIGRRIIFTNKKLFAKQISHKIYNKKKKSRDIAYFGNILRKNNSRMNRNQNFEGDPTFEALQKIHFPFVLFQLKDLVDLKKSLVQQEVPKQKVEMKCKGKFIFWGDMEAVARMGFSDQQSANDEVEVKMQIQVKQEAL